MQHNLRKKLRKKNEENVGIAIWVSVLSTARKNDSEAKR